MHRRSLLLLPGVVGCLVACQHAASDAELRRLQLLDEELLQLNQLVAKANAEQVRLLKAGVAKNYSQRRDIAVLERSTAVRAEAQQLVANLHQIRHQLLPGGQSTTPQQLADQQPVQQLLLRGSLVDSLQHRLGHFARQRQFYGLADFSARLDSSMQVSLHDARLGVALVMLAQQEGEVLRLESAIQRKLGEQVGSTTDEIEKIGAFASAESKEVAEGELYRAELLLAAAASSAVPTMTANGRPVVVGPDGKGRVTFVAPRLPAGQTRQQAYWEGTVSLRYNGRDSTFHLQVPYTIVRRCTPVPVE